MARDLHATDVLVAANVAVFVGGLATGRYGAIVDAYAFSVPAFLSGAWHRAVTGAFLHSGLPHLVYNMIFLGIFGRACEEEFGPWRTVAVYAAGMLSGNLFFAVLFPAESAIGASGAVFGLMAAGTLVEPGRPAHERFIPFPLALIAAAYLIPALGNAFNLGGNVANIAHVGGAAAGSLLAFAWAPDRARRGAVAVLGFTLLVLGLGLI